MKRNLFWVIISAVVMLFLPWSAVTFVNGDAGMAVCFLLLFAVNPIYSIVVGAFAGRNRKELWGQPIFLTILFLIGTWIFFDMGEMAFVWYAGIYLMTGLAAMLVSALITKQKR